MPDTKAIGRAKNGCPCQCVLSIVHAPMSALRTLEHSKALRRVVLYVSRVRRVNRNPMTRCGDNAREMHLRELGTRVTRPRVLELTIFSHALSRIPTSCRSRDDNTPRGKRAAFKGYGRGRASDVCHCALVVRPARLRFNHRNPGARARSLALTAPQKRCRIVTAAHNGGDVTDQSTVCAKLQCDAAAGFRSAKTSKVIVERLNNEIVTARAASRIG
jgi:hypothetical protein